MTRIVIIGGGPGGYEAALVGAQLGAEVTVVDCDGLGGASVLTDCVPSKTLIATAEVMTTFDSSYEELGIIVADDTPHMEQAARVVGVDLGKVNRRVKRLALAQSHDITASVTRAGARVMRGRGRLVGLQAADGSRTVVVTAADGTQETLTADAVLIATGGHPREIPDALPDGERILNWTQVYDLDELPEELIVVGSGVTGAEFAGAYQALGSRVTLVSSRDRVLPGEDPDAAAVLEDVFRRRGMNVMARSRALAAKVVPGTTEGPSSPKAGKEGRVGDRVEVTLADGRVISGSHCLMAVGAIPNSAGMGLEEAGVRLKESGHIWTDKVSRTTAPGVYAAGDVTGIFALASVAAMQGRIAMYHFLGDAVAPLNLKTVSSNVFTDPEIATVGYTQADVDGGKIDARVVKLPLLRNPRAKMQGIRDGFVKLFCRPGTGIVVGGCVVAPRASELIHPISIAVDNNLTVEQIANAFTVYPSLSGSIAEVARQLHTRKNAGEA
ncbi:MULTISPECIES: NAD(P)H-quinone dehydrogenase [unclassified Streptomyces]|uniref:NAD(P)H-quinone dehydrogenase n=1 Tax=unclassified Streptomyces TaxID=2593676 RepID=UPI00225B0E1F|nr:MULTISPECIES: NAD(P)H-quinone dehydrogenase [unclassified Streptomyces]WSP57101.1 NAD(P)H-quinone dehydrogenase [Streptomyces sp. NBC_01241]WSU22180.1 NAD(P)H-quinone dehydrogenase [Streptomyces sp. NBC_01108]MCX4788905.1 NAD(P)H-quinone dehydrogenase [Streptomyces sp. NBC_01221]MCX4795348.1 NAD(P)H-quinone dehydrogenase [Streptomyces sp. NBC_01242]WSJ36653.1 NAD(P)H-quinone dehydrogenase [Streptomyces sp. NBC_01321]